MQNVYKTGEPYPHIYAVGGPYAVHDGSDYYTRGFSLLPQWPQQEVRFQNSVRPLLLEVAKQQKLPKMAGPMDHAYPCVMGMWRDVTCSVNDGGVTRPISRVELLDTVDTMEELLKQMVHAFTHPVYGDDIAAVYRQLREEHAKRGIKNDYKE
jgi:hypothetical protein